VLDDFVFAVLQWCRIVGKMIAVEETMTKKPRCAGCGKLLGKKSSRGNCPSCYQNVRRAVLSGDYTWETALKRGLIRAKRKARAR